jgi:hypothetical protein
MVFILCISGITWMIITGTSREEVSECRKWESQAKEFGVYNPKNQTGFYLTKWQDQQCNAHGIKIDATVL